MSWFAELAGKAENLLTNLDEQTGVALRNQSFIGKHKKYENSPNEAPVNKKKRTLSRGLRNVSLHLNDQRHGTQMVPAKSSKAKLPRYKNSPVQNREDDNTLEPYGYKPRRYSYPADLNSIPDLAWFRRLENLEVENAMLKNELNVTNKEFKELLNRLGGTEEELYKAKSKLENKEAQNSGINIAKENLTKHVEKLKIDIDKTYRELVNYKEEKRELETEISVLRERNRDLSKLIKQYEKQEKETETIQNKTENDLRHSQSVYNHLQSDLNKTKEECKRLETEWESYRLRVKSMLKNKDKEIIALQQGVNLTEDTKILVDQLENLKDEREVLSKAVSQVRGECSDMKQHMETLKARHCVAERVVVALRDALKDERAARSNAEAALDDMEKEMKTSQMESGQKIAILQEALRNMENRMNRMLESPGSSSVATTISSAINVADYDTKASYQTEDKEKIEYLTDKLIKRQEQIEQLMADNIMLKIQAEKLESQWQANVLRGTGEHSVVSLQDGSHRLRAPSNKLSLTSKVSRWCGMLIRSHPLFGIFLLMYMVCLNIWVFTILLTSSQETKGYYYNVRPQLNPN